MTTTETPLLRTEPHEFQPPEPGSQDAEFGWCTRKDCGWARNAYVHATEAERHAFDVRRGLVTVAENDVSHCRKCHSRITVLGGAWTDPDGQVNCPGNLAVQADHDPVPASAVADMIMPWFEVHPGDLVLLDSYLVVVKAMWPSGLPADFGIEFTDDHGTRRAFVDSNALTAVRRYTEG